MGWKQDMMKPSPKCLVYTAVQGDYIGFKRIFEYCAKRAFPGADVQCDVFSGKITKFYAACHRYLYEPKGYDWVFATDADMALYPPRQGILSFFLREMEQNGMCYGNSSRTHTENFGAKRLTGVHFCGKEWYDRTRRIREKALAAMNAGLIGNGFFDDERLLWLMATYGECGIPPRVRDYHDRFCGLHIGVAYTKISGVLHGPTPTHLVKWRVRREGALAWRKWEKDPEFKDILKQTERDYPFAWDRIRIVRDACLDPDEDYSGNPPKTTESMRSDFDMVKEVFPEVEKCKTALYIGVNTIRHHLCPELKKAGVAITGLEIFEPYVKVLREWNEDTKLLAEVIHGDILDFETDRKWDVVIWWHGPEHVTRDEWLFAVPYLEAMANKGVLFGCPWGVFVHPPVDNNPAQEHKHHLFPADFEALGYKCSTRGVPLGRGGDIAAFKMVGSYD